MLGCDWDWSGRVEDWVGDWTVPGPGVDSSGLGLGAWGGLDGTGLRLELRTWSGLGPLENAEVHLSRSFVLLFFPSHELSVTLTIISFSGPEQCFCSPPPHPSILVCGALCDISAMPG